MSGPVESATEQVAVNGRWLSLLVRPGWNRTLQLMAAANGLYQLGMGMYLATFNNFAVDRLNLQPLGLGWLESLRETPGFLSAAVAGLTISVAEPLMAGISLLVMAVGIANYAGVSSLGALILWSVVWSTGFHTWLPAAQTIVLSAAEPGKEARRLGEMAGVGALANLVGFAGVLWASGHVSYSTIFLAAGSFAVLGGVVALWVPRPVVRPAPVRLLVRRRYALYYVLTLLQGWRKQVFITFAIFVLVRVYHTPLRTVATLMLVNGAVTMISAPLIGKLIDRLGERKALTLGWSGIILIFLGYAFIRRPEVLYLLYCLDNVLYGFGMGVDSYLKKIATREEMRHTLSLGVTSNHAGAVTMPLLGGYLWTWIGYSSVFAGGAVVAVLSLAAVQWLPRRIPVRADTVTV